MYFNLEKKKTRKACTLYHSPTFFCVVFARSVLIGLVVHVAVGSVGSGGGGGGGGNSSVFSLRLRFKI
jgi:hypothetical protein